MNLSSGQFWCSFQAVKIDVPLKLWEAITMDDGQHPFLTRFFHNKPYFYFVSFLRCYLSVLDPNFIIEIFPWWLLPFLLWAILFLLKKKWFFLVPFLFFPILFMQESLPLNSVVKVRIYQLYLWVLALFGAIYLLNFKRFQWKKLGKK